VYSLSEKQRILAVLSAFWRRSLAPAPFLQDQPDSASHQTSGNFKPIELAVFLVYSYKFFTLTHLLIGLPEYVFVVSLHTLNDSGYLQILGELKDSVY
jgi:hypothetical protein